MEENCIESEDELHILAMEGMQECNVHHVDPSLDLE